MDEVDDWITAFFVFLLSRQRWEKSLRSRNLLLGCLCVLLEGEGVQESILGRMESSILNESKSVFLPR